MPYPQGVGVGHTPMGGRLQPYLPMVSRCFGLLLFALVSYHQLGDEPSYFPGFVSSLCHTGILTAEIWAVVSLSSPPCRLGKTTQTQPPHPAISV